MTTKMAVFSILVLGPITTLVFFLAMYFILPAIRMRRIARERVSRRFLSAGNVPAV